MKPLLYILLKNLKNIVRDLKKKPLALILYTFLLLSFLGMIVLSFAMPSRQVGRIPAEAFDAVMTLVLLVVFYMGLSKGAEKGGSFFRLSDVNLVFTSPISPKRVLLYGFINQLYTSLIFLLFISFQIPNLKNNFAIKDYGIAIIYVSVLLLFIVLQLSGIILYSVSSRSPSFRKGFGRFMYAAVLLFIAGFLPRLLETRDILRAGLSYLNAPFFDYIPLIGWFRVVLTASVSGVDGYFWLNAALILAALGSMVFFFYKLNTDYYEDVLAATEKKEEQLKAVREGRGKSAINTGRARKVTQTYGGRGASAIFYRQLLEFRKSGYVFVNKNTLLIAVFGIASKYFFPYSSIKTVLYFTVYMLFFFSIQGKWQQELGKPYIYQLPVDSSQKVFYATLSDNLKNFTDGLVLFIAAGIMFKADPLTIVLSALAYGSFGAVYVYGDVLSQRLLGPLHSKNLIMFIKLFLNLFILLPGIVVSVAGGFVFKGVPFIDYYTTLVLIVYNLLASAVMLLIGRNIFDTLEMR